MTHRHDFAERRSGEPRREEDQIPPSPPPSKFTWQALSVLIAILFGLLSWLGAGVNDYRKVNDRLLTLENQRIEDRGRMERIESAQERMEAKIDRLLERTPK